MKNKNKMIIIRRPVDPIATRISAGGVVMLGNYMAYRGKIADVREILVECIQAIDEMEKEPEIEFSEYLRDL